MVESRDPVEKTVKKNELSSEPVIYFLVYRTHKQTKYSLTRNDLTVVDGKGNGENVLFVSNEPTSGLSGCDIPEPQLRIPTRREGKGTIRRDDDIGNKVRVTTETPTGVSIGIIVTLGGRVCELPDNHRLIAGRRKKKVGILRGSGETGDPVAMALQSSSQSQILGSGRHLESVFRVLFASYRCKTFN
jgi:hypothetical protein